MATFNGGRYLEESINSILNQTFQDFELIIVDDASTDNTPIILSKYQEHPKVRIYRSKNNLKLAASLNFAIDMARGHWIARQDDDDISHQDRLALQLEYLLKNPEIKLLGSRAEFTDERLITFAYWNVPESHEEILKIIKMENPFCHSSVLFDKQAICSIGKYRDKFNACEDLDLWLRVTENFKTHNLSRYLVKFRRHKYSVSVNYLEDQLAQHVLAQIFVEQRKLTGKDNYEKMPTSGYTTYLKDAYPEWVPFFKELKKSRYKSFLYEARKSRNWKKGIDFSICLAKSYPLDLEWFKEISFFMMAYTKFLLNCHLFWRVNRINELLTKLIFPRILTPRFRNIIAWYRKRLAKINFWKYYD